MLTRAGVHRAFGVVAAMEDYRTIPRLFSVPRIWRGALATPNCVSSPAHGMNSSIHVPLYLAGAIWVISPILWVVLANASQMLDHDTAELWDQMLYRSNQQMRFGDLRAGRLSSADRQNNRGCPTRPSPSLSWRFAATGYSLHADLAEIVQPGDILIVMGLIYSMGSILPRVGSI